MVTSWQGSSETIRYSITTDIPKIAAMLCDPAVGRWLWFTPAPPEMFESFFGPFIDAQDKDLAEDRVPQTAVFTVEDHDGAFLGQGAVIAVEGSPGGFEIGFQLSEQSWGRGVGKRLAEFLCAYAIHKCSAFRIEGSCLEGNTGSRAILTKLGLNIEGTRPNHRVKEETRHTELLFGAEVSRLDETRFRTVAEAVGLHQ